MSGAMGIADQQKQKHGWSYLVKSLHLNMW